MNMDVKMEMKMKMKMEMPASQTMPGNELEIIRIPFHSAYTECSCFRNALRPTEFGGAMLSSVGSGCRAQPMTEAGYSTTMTMTKAMAKAKVHWQKPEAKTGETHADSCPASLMPRHK